MKKYLTTICILISIFTISFRTFAQGDPGGGNNEKPSYISDCKRNNGNGTSAGAAEVRLNFIDKNFHNVIFIVVEFDLLIPPGGFQARYIR